MIFVPIAHFEGRYSISDTGLVMNHANNKGLTAIENNNGYFKVSLAKGDGTSEQHLIHILVARHFLPNPYNYPQVNHKNGMKFDCTKSNLEWCSVQQNNEHALRTGLRPGYMSADEKETHLASVLSGVQVNEIAAVISRRPETLHKMLRETAKRLGVKNQWDTQMKENRRVAAIRNLTKINN